MYDLLHYLTGNFSDEISLVWVFKRQVTVSIDDQLAQESAVLTNLLGQLTSVDTCQDKAMMSNQIILFTPSQANVQYANLVTRSFSCQKKHQILLNSSED